MALKDNLVAHWKLDETSGDRVDSHASKDLTASANVAYTAGKLGNAAALAAANFDFLTVAEGDGLDTGADTAWTVACWIKHGSFAQALPFIVGKTNSRSALARCVIGLTLSADRAPQARVGNNAFSAVATWGTPTSDNAWHFVVAWHDPAADVVAISVDNGDPVTTQWTGGTYNNVYGFHVGAAVTTTGTVVNGSCYTGAIDSLSVWIDRVLSSADRAELYNSGAGLEYASWDITAAPQTIEPGFIASPETVYAPTVVFGAVSVTPGHIASAEAVYEPTLVPGAVTLVVGFIASAEAVYAPTLEISPGDDQTVEIDFVASEEAIYEPWANLGDVLLVRPSFIASADQVFTPRAFRFLPFSAGLPAGSTLSAGGHAGSTLSAGGHAGSTLSAGGHAGSNLSAGGLAESTLRLEL